ncbi:hypothetical protein A2U01_0078933, partial [Trifolium medium]|nr:hypothetical protein [Trifolium medium]
GGGGGGGEDNGFGEELVIEVSTAR